MKTFQQHAVMLEKKGVNRIKKWCFFIYSLFRRFSIFLVFKKLKEKFIFRRENLKEDLFVTEIYEEICFRSFLKIHIV